MRLDLFDCIVCGGMACIAMGCGMLSPWLGVLVFGFELVLVGITGAKWASLRTRLRDASNETDSAR